tara:strand:- start:405 stop:1211 length:807 start_codon:yes stop_codon:yes gene_type:complete
MLRIRCSPRLNPYHFAVEEFLFSSFEIELQELITQALKKAVKNHGPSRLLGRKSGLFPGGNTKSRAVKFCLESDPPLLLREGERSKKRPLHVRLTPHGIERLVEFSPPAEREELIAESSPVYQHQLLKHWADLASKRDWKDDFARIEAACSKLIGEIQSIIPKPEKSPSTPSADSDKASFKRDLAHELVISWKYAKTEEAREGIARALRASGVQQVGEAGELVQFIGRRHICSDAVFPGDNVEIVRAGWVVHDGVGEYLLEKATVRAI